MVLYGSTLPGDECLMRVFFHCLAPSALGKIPSSHELFQGYTRSQKAALWTSCEDPGMAILFEDAWNIS